MRDYLWLCAAISLASASASAQERATVVVVDDAAETARARAWQRRVEEALDARIERLTEWSRALAPIDTAAPEALGVLSQIEALLVSARASAARLEERRALSDLTRAEELARSNLAIPGMAAWYAEVQLALAVTAAQAGEASLASAALRRAASVDPSRLVAAAEARPDVVERSRAAVQAAITGPRGRFEVAADAPGARVFLDDHPLGELPRVVEAPVGPHVLRVDAPGHLGWAQLVDVLEGDRPAIVVRLAPTAAHGASVRVERAAREGRVAAVDEALRALPAPPSVWLLWTGAGSRDRAVAVRCTHEGCDPPRRLEASSLRGQLAAPGTGDLVGALTWMDQPLDLVVAHEEWWQRWYVWAVAGVLLAGAVTTAVLLAEPQGPAPLRFTFAPTW